MSVDRAALYREHRPFLMGLAYRMLGTVAEAEDAVHEAFLRAEKTDLEGVGSPRAWLATVVTRVCVDVLRSARARRETYVGEWLPEPVRTDVVGAPLRPADPADAETLSIAFLVLLERLSPLERAAFLLHEVFDYTHGEVAEALGRDEPAVRQLVRRAREHVREGRPRFDADPERNRETVSRFVAALGRGDIAAVESMLARDVVARSDGGGKVAAATRAVQGADKVARFLVGLGRKAGPSIRYELVEVNGGVALAWATARGAGGDDLGRGRRGGGRPT
ncbi:MAG: RNA polymerase sigma factor SigJ [Polyangiales bacterium]